jgi:uncharacterized repeat protein (TIGR01451 family)
MKVTMKSPRILRIAIALFAALAPCVSQATVFFSDTLTNGSTINSVSPANPTLTNTAYQVISAKTYSPTPSISSTSSDLRFGIASTSSGAFEIQALFATNPIALVLPGDYIQLTIVFTNTTGLLALPGPGSSQLGIGLYNSGQAKPLPGGTNATTLLTNPGNANNWLGYVGQITSGANRIMTRPSQATAIDGWNQEVVLSGSSTATYRSQTTVGSAVAGTVTLTTNAPYTEVLTITMNDVNSLAITNILYSGPDTSGTVITNFGGIATNTTFLTGGFDAFALGYQTKVAGNPSLFDVFSVQVSGSVTAVSGPPTINQQPVNVTVPNGGSCAFSIAATGYSVTYQWHRNGTNLLNGGNISGATSSQLIISPASAADVAANYYVTVTGTGPFSTNSELHSLSLGTANNLVYSGSGNWDLNTSPSWIGGLMFNFGDAVTFDDTGAGGNVPLVGSYLSASSVTVNSSAAYTFSGTGSFAGPGKLIYIGANQLTINNPNTYSGGTIISNATANLRLQNLAGLGTGPVTLAQAGGKLELLSTGSASSGIQGDVVVQDDFTIQADGAGTYAVVFLGNLAGTSNKTLTINPQTTGYTNRIRVYGTNTVCNANLVLNNTDSAISQAIYGGTTFAPYGASGSQTYNGVISGVVGIVQRGTGLTILNGQNTYSGGTFTTAGGIALGVDSTPTTGTVTSGPLGVGPLFVSPEVGSANGSGTVQAANGARTIANPIQYPSATNNQTLIIGGTNNLTFSGSFALNGQDGTTPAVNRTLQVNNTAATTISGVISDNSLGFGLIKTGTGALYLNAANTYTGTTTNSGGLLAGSGSLAGSVVVSTNATIGGGTASAIGTFTINGNLILTNLVATNGGGFFRVNRSGLASDKVSVAGMLTNAGTGTITVTNLGTTLQVGDKFYLFNKAMSNGAALTVTGGGVAWTNALAVDGSIVVSTPPDLGVQLTAPASVMLGVNLTNVITVTNIGPGIASGIVVTDTLPANVTFVSATGSGTTNSHSGLVVWSVASLAANTATNFTLIVTPTAGGNVTNIVNVAGSLADSATANNTATNITLVTTIIVPTVSAHIGTFNLVSGNVVIGGTNGVNGGTYYLLCSTNVAKPLSQWTTVATNVVSASGASGAFTFTGTNVVSSGVGQQFYILSNTNN